jgi:hypothetical protein
MASRAENNMTRTDRYRKWLIATCAVAALSFAPNPAGAADACPTPALDHVPTAPPGPLNVGTIKPLLLDYHARFYDDDVAAVFNSAQKFMEQNATQSKRPVIVLDIDETSLTNWPNLAADDFGFVPGGACDLLPFGPCGFNDWILKSSAEAIEPALKLFKAAKLRGVGVIFITGRPNSQRDATVINLEHAGFDGWTELRTRPDHDTRTVQEYKMDERIAVETGPEGYTIIANIGDQISDIDGGHGGCTFKVPNPFYFIP